MLRQFTYNYSVNDFTSLLGVAIRVTGSETQGFVVHWHLIYEQRSWSSKLSRSSVGMKERAVYTAGSRGSLAALRALRFDRGDGKIWRMSMPSTSFKNSLPHWRKRERDRENIYVCVYVHVQVCARSHVVSFDFILIALSVSLFFSFSLSFFSSLFPNPMTAEQLLFLHTPLQSTILRNSRTDVFCTRCKIGVFWCSVGMSRLVGIEKDFDWLRERFSRYR